MSTPWNLIEFGYSSFLWAPSKKKGNLQITSLNFGGVWILHFEISEFEIYLLKFGGVWILFPNVLEFGYYSLKFVVIWILHLQILKF